MTRARVLITVGIAVPIVSVLIGLVTNQASSQRRWPGWLEFLRAHPWPSLIVLTLVSVGLTSLAALRPAALRPKEEISLPDVADKLAVAVGAQWSEEVAMRRLKDPFPLAVSWVAADPSLTESWDELVTIGVSGTDWPPSTWARGPEELAGSGNQLATVLESVPTGRLVVLGDPGAGKTMLMVRLVLDLLRDRVPGGPVPVLISMASWDPSESKLFDWLASRLVIDYPALARRSVKQDPTRALALLAANLIVPILDGLDEIPGKSRGLAVTAINEALQLGVRFVLTCRTDPYRQAVRPQHGAEATLRAAAIELKPLTADMVSEYLRADAPGPVAKARWDPITAALGTQAPVAQALTNPLMVGLARVIYNTRPVAGDGPADQPDPAELLNQRLTDKEAVKAHLLDAYIPAAYRQGQGTDPRWKADDAKRYLVFLARHIKDETTDIAWWKLAEATPKHLIGLMVGLLVALASAVAYPFIGWGLGLIIGIITGLIVRRQMHIDEPNLTRGILGGLLGGTIGALLALAVLGPGARNYNTSGLVAAGLAIGLAMASMRHFTTSLIASFAGSIVAAFYEHAPFFYAVRTTVGPWLHLINALGFGLTALTFVELADRKTPARRLRLSPVWLALGVACGTVLGIGVWLQTGWLQGLTAGLVTALAGALVGGMGETVATDPTSPADPRAILRRDRIAFLTAWLGFGFMFGLGGGLALGVSPNLAGQPNGVRIGVLVGLANVVVVGLTFAFIQAMWGSFTLARFWLATFQHLPWHYMTFLNDAHQRGVLKQAGAVYQFRHIELQERLAAATSPTISASLPGHERGLTGRDISQGGSQACDRAWANCEPLRPKSMPALTVHLYYVPRFCLS